MNRKAVSGMIMTLLLTAVLTCVCSIQPAGAEPRTWTVDDDEPADFHTIQEAVDAASSGDTISVKAGTYYERLTINKRLILIGESRENTTVDAFGTGEYWQNAFNVWADYVTIKGFTIQNGFAGIKVWVDYCTIVDNIIRNNSRYGLMFGDLYHNYHSYHNTISDNVIEDNECDIRFCPSSHNKVIGNLITRSHCGYYGIRVDLSDHNLLANNTITSDWIQPVGIGIHDGSNNTIVGNTITNCAEGIRVLGGYVSCVGNVIVGNTITNCVIWGVTLSLSCNNIVVRNTFADGGFQGINVLFSSLNLIQENNIARHEIGLMLHGSDLTAVIGNNVTNNIHGLILLDEGGNNHISHNNFIDNRYQALLWGAYHETNFWDDDYPSGGNYWSDQYHGDCADHCSGPYQNETGSDGIVDTPYVIDENNQDNYPLMEPWTPKPTTPIEASEELIETIETWNLDKGTESSLVSKLEDVIHLLEKGNENGAMHKLLDFIDQVEGLRGKKLTDEQADYLIAEAQRIIDLIQG